MKMLSEDQALAPGNYVPKSPEERQRFNTELVESDPLFLSIVEDGILAKHRQESERRLARLREQLREQREREQELLLEQQERSREQLHRARLFDMLEVLRWRGIELPIRVTRRLGTMKYENLPLVQLAVSAASSADFMRRAGLAEQ